jgi:hypothetical protein
LVVGAAKDTNAQEPAVDNRAARDSDRYNRALGTLTGLRGLTVLLLVQQM